MGFCFNLFVGGLDTVSTNIGHQFRHLAERADHQAVLRREPERIPEALEEFLREMRIAIEEFFAAIPEFRIKPGATVESYLGGMVTPILLPLVW